MALIKCPECGSMISDKSNACIHCGYPIVLAQSTATPKNIHTTTPTSQKNLEPNIATSSNKTVFPTILTVILSILALLTMFMPCATATNEYAYILKGLTQEDLIHISMYDFAKYYNDNGNNAFLIGTIIFATSSILLIFFSSMKKICSMIICNFISFISFSAQFAYYDIAQSDIYNYGVGFFTYLAISLLILISTIWLSFTKNNSTHHEIAHTITTTKPKEDAQPQITPNYPTIQETTEQKNIFNMQYQKNTPTTKKWVCKKCGEQNPSSSISCKGCGAYK